MNVMKKRSLPVFCMIFVYRALVMVNRNSAVLKSYKIRYAPPLSFHLFIIFIIPHLVADIPLPSLPLPPILLPPVDSPAGRVRVRSPDSWGLGWLILRIVAPSNRAFYQDQGVDDNTIFSMGSDAFVPSLFFIFLISPWAVPLC
jgi:hypothetical protein